MRAYEALFIFDPSLEDEPLNEEIEKITSIIEQGNGKIVESEQWGRRTLSYPLQKKKDGFYALIQFSSEPDVLKKLKVELKHDESILRYSVVKMKQDLEPTSDVKEA